MPQHQELSGLMGELPAALQDGGSAATGMPTAGTDLADPTDVDDEEVDEELDDEQQDDDTEGDGSDVQDGDGDDEGNGEEQEDDDDQEDYFTEDDEEEEPEKPAVEKPAGAPAMTDKREFILGQLPKIKTNIIVTGADNRKSVKSIEVYGWGDLLNTPGYTGFADAREQGMFTANAQNNELKARELDAKWEQNKIQADTDAYTAKENRAVARDLQALRKEGVFPKFKGVPGSRDFDNSDGAKMFDEVVAYMNEQNDELGRNAQKGDAFYHISFRQAYRILHPEAFNDKKKAAQRNADQQMARRVRSGGQRPQGQRRNVQTRRVANINDLQGEFENFIKS